MRQDAAWFDATNVGALITQLTEGVDKIEIGIGEKVGMFVQQVSLFAGGMIVAFLKNWELSVVAAAVVPLVLSSYIAVALVVRKLNSLERAAYARANGIAGEVLESVKTVFAFEGQKRELKRYSQELLEAERVGFKRAIIFNLSKSISIFCRMFITGFFSFFC